VTLGTIGYGFRSLVEEMIRLLPEGAEVTWQTGATDISELTIQAVASMPAKSLEAHIAQADVVVAHSGVGSALAALNAGKVPVLVPRRSSRGEHVDDHQQLIARELAGRGLAVYAELDELDLDHLRRAAGRRVVSSPGPDATTPPPQH
jgi:UDP-N-acetylglucosamine--N-acetylmuramyl-(pentapeptide) pyrophosphoryl-undecaprenol N-acetylglucosamine transferase